MNGRKTVHADKHDLYSLKTEMKALEMRDPTELFESLESRKSDSGQSRMRIRFELYLLIKVQAICLAPTEVTHGESSQPSNDTKSRKTQSGNTAFLDKMNNWNP